MAAAIPVLLFGGWTAYQTADEHRAAALRTARDPVARDRGPAIGGIGPVGPVSGKRLVALRVPVVKGGALTGVSTVARKPDAVGNIRRSAGIPAG